MKRLVATMVVLGLIAVALISPAPAFANGGRFWGGFAVGAFTGAIVGHILAPPVIYAAPPVVYQPAPVYYPAPAYYPAPVYYPSTTCYDSWVGGYWYYGTWVPAHWERACR